MLLGEDVVTLPTELSESHLAVPSKVYEIDRRFQNDDTLGPGLLDLSLLTTQWVIIAAFLFVYLLNPPLWLRRYMQIIPHVQPQSP